jgi:YD repeat-containing protein
VRLFIGGALVGTATFSDGAENTADTLKIGVGNDLSGGFNGYVDEVRITKGLARYTAAFAVPTSPFANSATSTPAVPSSMDVGVPNRVWTYTYNQYGQVLTAKGPRTDVNDTTTYEYYTDTTVDHTLGDLKKVTNAKGQATQFTQYNKAGQVLRMVDASAVTTDYTYDARQRLKTVSVAGRMATYDYLPSGQLKRVTQADASYVDYSYDDAQRLIAVSDNLGNRIDYLLDSTGNRTSESVQDSTGALRRQLTRVTDALKRVQQVIGRE